MAGSFQGDLAKGYFAVLHPPPMFPFPTNSSIGECFLLHFLMHYCKFEKQLLLMPFLFPNPYYAQFCLKDWRQTTRDSSKGPFRRRGRCHSLGHSRHKKCRKSEEERTKGKSLSICWVTITIFLIFAFFNRHLSPQHFFNFCKVMQRALTRPQDCWQKSALSTHNKSFHNLKRYDLFSR